MFVDQVSYMKNSLSETGGIRLTVHHPQSFPLINEYGVNLQVITKLTIKQAFQVSE